MQPLDGFFLGESVALHLARYMYFADMFGVDVAACMECFRVVCVGSDSTGATFLECFEPGVCLGGTCSTPYTGQLLSLAFKHTHIKNECKPILLKCVP